MYLEFYNLEIENQHQDFFSESSIITYISFAELIDKIIKADINNAICLFSIVNRFALNIKLSSLAIAASVLNHKLTEMGKKDADSKTKLPKMTYLSFVGYYYEIDIDVLC